MIDNKEAPDLPNSGSINNTIAMKNREAGAALGASNGVTAAVGVIFFGCYLLLYGKGYHSTDHFWEWLFLGGACLVATLFVLWGLFQFRQGKCPYCEKTIGAIPFFGKIKCKSCKKRILFKDERFWTIA